MTSPPTELLAGLRVVELVGPFGDACSRLLGSLGAEVTRVHANAYAADPRGSAAKQVPLGGLASASEREAFLELILASDVLIEAEGAARLRAWRLEPEALRAHNPALIHASITAFGYHGPFAQFRGSELVCAAMGGVLRLVGDADRAPVKEALDACSFHAQAAAAAAIMLAYHERAGSGLGQHIDISIQEVAASRLTNAVLLWQFDRKQLARSGQQLRYGRAAVRCIWQLRDGYVFHSLMSGRFGAPANAALSAWLDELGADNPLRDVNWLSYDRSALPAEVRAVWEVALEKFFRERTKHEIATEGRRRGINASVVQEPADVLADPQLAARAFWTVAGPLRTPGPFMHVTASNPPRASGHAPPPTASSAHGRPAGGSSPRSKYPWGAPPPRDEPAAGALAGVKVLDLSWALVGSLATKALGDHGACVVKVESSGRPCLTRVDAQVARSTSSSFDDKPWFAHLNSSKLSLRLDLKHARARELLDPLVDWADVVVENFSPGTLDKLALGYAQLRQRKPDLIMLSASAYGQTGPLAQSWGVDGTSAALAGRTWLTGWPDRGPVLPSAVPYADVVVPQFMVAALGAALTKRRSTGQGCYIDISMYEISVQQMQRALRDAQVGCCPERSGNRDREVWHQGVYPARGHDRWIAISVFDSDDMRRLTQLLGGDWPNLAALQRADAAARDAFDQQLGARTCEHDAFALMQQLQAAGIAAGVVQDAADLLERDPQLRARPAWSTLDHPILGAFDHQTTPYHLARTPARLGPAPLLGQHNEQVCLQILGLSPEHYAALVASDLFK